MWKKYKRKGLSEMRPYLTGDDLTGVSISDADRQAGSPKEGDMIARNPKNNKDRWLVAKAYFEDNLELASEEQKGDYVLVPDAYGCYELFLNGKFIANGVQHKDHAKQLIDLLNRPTIIIKQ